MNSPFHLGVFLTMNILFWENLALYPLLLADLDGARRGNRPANPTRVEWDPSYTRWGP